MSNDKKTDDPYLLSKDGQEQIKEALKKGENLVVINQPLDSSKAMTDREHALVTGKTSSGLSRPPVSLWPETKKVGMREGVYQTDLDVIREEKKFMGGQTKPNVEGISMTIRVPEAADDLKLTDEEYAFIKGDETRSN